MKTAGRIFLLWFVFLFVTACATAQTTSTQKGSAEQLVSQLEADIGDARSRNIDILSPGLFKEAQTSLVNAKRALDSGAKISTIKRYVGDGNASLMQAEKLAMVSNTILKDTNEARQKALRVNADQLGKPYIDAEKDYLKLTKAIENDNLSYAQKNAANVQASFQELEIMAIKNNALYETREMMASAEKNKINKIAPTAYSEASQSLNEVESYIESNPYDAATIEQKADTAAFMAKRMLSISESSKKFEGMTPEASALYVESLFVQLSEAAKVGDIRDQEVEDQVGVLTGKSETMQQHNQALENKNIDYEAKIVDLEKRLVGVQGYSREQEAAKQKLTAEKEFVEQFNTVQRYFEPEEAEVYKQGRNLVIRLRGIKFPVGKATLTPENYTLLSKVQKAIQTFDQPKVTIEGHTDSTGRAQINQELSQQRADAVKTYLVANKTIPANDVQSIGYGPDRPLASNSTPEGRAINRRIDVLISPTHVPGS